MKGSHRKCEEAPKKYDENRRASSSFGMLNGANAAHGKVIWKAPPLKRFKGGTVILCGDKEMNAPHLVRFCGTLCGGALSGTTSPLRGSCRRKRRGEPTTKDTPCGVCALSGTTSPLWGSCRLRRGEPTTKDTPCGVYALSGATSPLGGSCRRKRRGEPTSVISDSFSPTSSFGCGSSPESATKENEECKSIPHFLGALSGTRTLGPLIKSQLLYQLS